MRIAAEAKHGIISRPLAAALVEHFDGDVKFQRLLDKPAANEPKPAGTKVKILRRGLLARRLAQGSRAKQLGDSRLSRLDRSSIAMPEHILERMRKAAAERYAKALNVKQIDWDKQMIIGVSAGVQPAGSTVEIMKIDQNQDKSLTVHWRLHADPIKTAKSIINTAEVVLVERTPGEVKFVQEAEHEE